MKYGKIVSVTVRQDRRAIMPDVIFKDALDTSDNWGFLGEMHKYVSKSSLNRLATAINNMNMQLELDEYGVPTWTRRENEK